MTTSPLATPLPSIAMSWPIGCGFLELIVTLPAVGVGVGELVGEAGRRATGMSSVPLTSLAVPCGLGDADRGEGARVLARRGRDRADVGGDVARVLARDQVGRHLRQLLAGRRVDLRVAVGVRICPRTMPANVELFPAVARAWANAASRFGPVTPVVPARASVWHAPQWLDEQLLAVEHVRVRRRSRATAGSRGRDHDASTERQEAPNRHGLQRVARASSLHGGGS